MIASKPVVAGIDFSSSSAKVLRHAACTATAEGVPLLAVHVVDPARLPHRVGCRPSAVAIEAAVRSAKQQLARLVREHAGDAVVEELVMEGHPVDEFQRLVAREQAGLLVIAAHEAPRGWADSLARGCVRTLPCDVLLLSDRVEDEFRRVMACVDFSPVSGTVLGRAIEAARSRAVLDIVHVMFPPDRDLWGETLDLEAERFVEESRAETREAMERVTREYRAALAPLVHRTCIVESAVPSVELTCRVGDTAADLVVLGTRGHSRLGAVFLDTNAERLLHDAMVSVLAVRR